MSVAVIYSLVTPFADTQLVNVGYEQTGDGIVLTHLDHPPQLLQRYGHNDWRIGAAPIGVASAAPATVTTTRTNPNASESADGYVESQHQYAVSAVMAATNRESQVTDGGEVDNDITVKGNFNTTTWSAVTGALEYRVYRKKNGSYGYIGTVLATNPREFLDDNIIADFTDSPPTLNNPFSGANYPATVTFHNRRTFYGRTLLKPSAVFGSQIDDLFNHDKSRPLRATDSMAFNLVGRRVNIIRHMLSLGDLILFGSDGLFSIRPGGDGVLSPTSLQTRSEGYQGVGAARPEAADAVAFYSTQRGNAIRTLNYTFERDGYRGSDITIYAPHFFQSYELLSFAWCEHPSSTLFALRDDGQMPTLTWQAEQDVWGWTLCYTGGTIESICSVSEEGRDALYAVIQREIDGEDRRYVERLTEPLWIDENWLTETPDGLKDAVVMDSAYTYRGTARTTLFGLDWLEGEDVAVLADGLVITGRSVVDGALTPPLENAASVITVGLGYESYARTLPVVGNTQGGSTKGRSQEVSNVIIEVMNTLGTVAGSGDDPVLSTLYDTPLPDDVLTTTPMVPYSGLLDTNGLEATNWNGPKVTVAQLQPLPMVVLGIYAKIEFGG